MLLKTRQDFFLEIKIVRVSTKYESKGNVDEKKVWYTKKKKNIIGGSGNFIV